MQRPKRPDELAREAAGDPPEPLGTRATTIGTVKYWRDDKGYGVIASDATAPWDIWCHFMRISDMPGFRSLQPGDRVDPIKQSAQRWAIGHSCHDAHKHHLA